MSLTFIPEKDRKLFSDDNVQTIPTVQSLFQYLPTKLGQKIFITGCGYWYNTKEESDGNGGKRMCWVPWKNTKNVKPQMIKS